MTGSVVNEHINAPWRASAFYGAFNICAFHDFVATLGGSIFLRFDYVFFALLRLLAGGDLRLSASCAVGGDRLSDENLAENRRVL